MKSAVFALLFVLALPAAASAHAERGASTPEPGDRLAAPPREVKVDFTEPPTGDSTFRVLDGCERDVVEDFEILNGEITAMLSAGQPGSWVVSWQVVSAVDGHPTKDRMSFTVEGEPDCTAAVESPTIAASEPPAPDDENDDGGSSALTPILIFSAALVGLAVVGRLVFR